MKYRFITNLIITLVALFLATGCAGMKKKGRKGAGAPRNNNAAQQQDPLAEDLQDKINDLEEQNGDLQAQLQDLLNQQGLGLGQNPGILDPSGSGVGEQPPGTQPPGTQPPNGPQGLVPGPGLDVLRGQSQDLRGLTAGPGLTPEEAVRRVQQAAQRDVHGSGAPIPQTSGRPPATR